MSYDNTNSGALFKKEDRTSPKSPDYEGRINVGGKDYRLVAWIKEGKSGKKYMSLSVSEPKSKPVENTEPEFPKTELPKVDVSSIPDELPF